MGWGEGEGAIFEPKTLSMYLKKEKNSFGGGGSVGGVDGGVGVGLGGSEWM